MYTPEEFFKNAEFVDSTDVALQPNNVEDYMKFCQRTILKQNRDQSILNNQVVGSEVY